jgi:TonB family protein
MKQISITCLLLVFAFSLHAQSDSIQISDSVIYEIQQDTVEFDDDDDADMEDVPEEIEETGEIYEFFQVQEKAHFKGGEKAMYAFISKHLEFPDAALEAGVNGRVIVQFVVERDGSIEDVSTFGNTKLGFGTEEAAIKVVKQMNGHWEPAIQRNRPVRMRFRLPFMFLAEVDTKKEKRKKNSNKDSVAVFEGGKRAYKTFVKQNLRYPETAKLNSVQGKVLISFVVDTDGKVSNVRVISKERLGHGCEKEAIRFIKSSSGRWLPGTKHKTNIKSKLEVPLEFKK